MKKFAVKKPILIYGTGNGASVLIHFLKNQGKIISDVAVSDEFARGQIFEGFEVKKISEALKKSEDFSIFVSFGSDRDDVIDYVSQLNEKYDLYVPEIPLNGNFFDEDKYIEEKAEIDFCRSLFADEYSKKLYDSMIKYKLKNRFDDLMKYTQSRAESLNLLSLNPDMIYADLGAYRGDTLYNFKKIYAFEPASKNIKHLILKAEKINADITVIEKAVSDKTGYQFLSSDNGRGAKITDRGLEVETISLDEYFENKKLDFIKMDIEGQEKKALMGAKKVIVKNRPSMLISAYHYTDDFYKIPLLINDFYKNIKIYLRREKCFPSWELNLYIKPE
ncbi:MAG: FkbM family methyltransferase [Clostridia bacterium]|nr:FkbM family methyltransferase [Clostridia bacterium]